MSKQTAQAEVNSKAGGLVIALSAIVSIIAVALDATAGGTDAQSIMKSMIGIQASHQTIHVVAMTCLGGLMFGFSIFSQRLGLRRAPVLAGLIAYGAGTVLMLLATIIDGLVTTDTALMFVNKSPELIKVGYAMIEAMNVVLIDVAKVSWVLQSVAVLCWACALVRERGVSRIVGSIGLVAGALPAITVFMVGSNMTDNVVVGILLLQAVWNLAAAALMMRSGATAPSSLGSQAALAA